MSEWVSGEEEHDKDGEGSGKEEVNHFEMEGYHNENEHSTLNRSGAHERRECSSKAQSIDHAHTPNVQLALSPPLMAIPGPML